MQAIILAGGKGLRLREVIKDKPKSMAEIAGKPFLEYLIIQLVRWGIKDIVLSVGYKKTMIKAYFGDGADWGVKITYSEEEKPLGTGGAIREAAKFIKNEDFLVMNGDSFFDVDFNKLTAYHKKKNGICTIGLVKVRNTKRYGSVILKDNGSVSAFLEKTNSGCGFINGGIYVFKRELFKRGFSDGKISLETQVLLNIINQGLYGMALRRFFIDIGVPSDYLFLSKNPEIILECLN
jgi:D-glycero-alpha-D-manno-heptose 1-phosphate guanylyltransferase